VFKVLIQQLYQVYGNFSGHFAYSAVINYADDCPIYQMIDFFRVIKIGLINVCVQMRGFSVITFIVFLWRPYWKMVAITRLTHVPT